METPNSGICLKVRLVVETAGKNNNILRVNIMGCDDENLGAIHTRRNRRHVPAAPLGVASLR